MSSKNLCWSNSRKLNNPMVCSFASACPGRHSDFSLVLG
ncbi:hypothetical protein MXB_694 [Myxobolus squamalis]|nr:hypothetical protein MXB_694 [Myxobolus squamalis]